MTADFGRRAEENFRNRAEEMTGAIDTMLADHSKHGRLQSGATIKAALRIFEENASSALAQTLGEAGRLIEHRRRAWRDAMAAIGRAVDAHLACAREYLDQPLKVADRQATPSIVAATDQELVQIGVRLQRQLGSFRDGWTAPLPKAWKDRHPFQYAVLLLLIGTIFGSAVTVTTDALKGRPPTDVRGAASAR